MSRGACPACGLTTELVTDPLGGVQDLCQACADVTPATPGPTTTAKVELYNLTAGGRAVGNGYLVARYVDGRRANTLRKFGSDEGAARAYAATFKGMTPAELEAANYPPFVTSYSGEAFDRAQGLANRLTDGDRAAGRPAPAYGYSTERFAEAERIVSAANGAR